MNPIRYALPVQSEDGAIIDVSPNDDGLPGITQFLDIVGAMMTIGLICAVLGLIISGIVWAFGANSTNPQLSGRGKTGVLVALGVAALCGASVAAIDFFWDVGQQV